ncbi:hypothetical protein AC579_5756 [Pseudocercospora musae]|uniref:Uncharacterized protein n=1 Tax=Pseudocercospora musae TaxID=113226 RepID=A0A139ISD5_9PEZI|nr:hypothetical protein AC579_5756 [Pseudocercospora musae]
MVRVTEQSPRGQDARSTPRRRRCWQCRCRSNVDVTGCLNNRARWAGALASTSKRTGYEVTVIVYEGLDSNATDLGTLLTQADHNAQLGKHTICIVENISPEFVGGLGVAWDIPRDFFVRHATNPTGALWESVMGRQARDRVEEISTADWDDDLQNQISQRVTARHFHVEDIFEHLHRDEHLGAADGFRRCFQHDAHYGWQANTQISCYRVSAFL